MLTTVHPTLNDHEYNMRPACVVHAIWRHFVPEPFTSFFYILWSVLWLRHQVVTDVTAWLITPNLSCSKNRKEKEKIKYEIKIKIKSIVSDLDILDSVPSEYTTKMQLCAPDELGILQHISEWARTTNHSWCSHVLSLYDSFALKSTRISGLPTEHDK